MDKPITSDFMRKLLPLPVPVMRALKVMSEEVKRPCVGSMAGIKFFVRKELERDSNGR